MYRFSRSIFRELAPYVVEDRLAAVCSNQQKVLEACESTIRRLTYDRHYFARPTRTLFNDIRTYFPLAEQTRVYMVIERNVNLALERLAELPGDGFGLDGEQLHCRATTRRGKPCQRQPLSHNQYCPSHQHLAESDEALTHASAAA